jgi:hypothetical protein
MDPGFHAIRHGSKPRCLIKHSNQPRSLPFCIEDAKTKP